MSESMGAMEAMRAAPEEEPAARPQYASWGRRAAALILDDLLIGVLTGVIIGILYAADAGDSAVAVGYIVGVTVLPLLYFGLLWGSESGQTLASKLLGIRVRSDKHGGPIGTATGL